MHVTPRQCAALALSLVTAACADQSARLTEAPAHPSALSTTPASNTLVDDGIALEMVVRDLRGVRPANPLSHPDFENAIGAESGLVASQLGPDRKPVFSGIAAHTVTSAATFDEWWRNSPRTLYTRLPLVLAPVGPTPGYYEYRSGSFFPIDNQLLGNQENDHNFHFTVEVHALFTYRGGETVSITADDDSWLFVNGKLVIDLGGVHGQSVGTVNLDELGLTPDEIYTFDLFHAERHTLESAFRIVTNAGLFLPYRPYDPTAPSVIATVAGPRGNDGWYVGDATIDWRANDDESAITSSPCPTVTVHADTPGTTYTCTATSSGPTGHGNVEVRRDATPPAINFTGGKATYESREPISVACVATDATSGVPSSDCGSIALAAGTLAPGHHELTRSATDRAGNTATATFSFDVLREDTTPPDIEATVDGPRSSTGWYTGTVSLRWQVSDAESAISATTGCGPAEVTADTPGTVFACVAASAGGTNRREIVIQRDATAPAVTFSGGASSYDIADHVTIDCLASDATSGIATETCPTLDVDAAALGAGSHALHGSATDRAGNSTTASVTFDVAVNYDGVSALVQRWVADASIAKSLLAKLENARRAGGKGGKSARNMIEAFINEVRAQSGKKIPAARAELLEHYARLL